MKNIIITFLLITFSLTLLTAQDSQANMFNRFKKGFYFEKYKTAEEAKEALLKLHPVGSDVGGLIRTVEGAGAKFYFSKTREELLSNPAREKEYFIHGISSSAFTVKGYKYNNGIKIINPILWSVIIFYDKNNLITDLHSAREYNGL